MSAPAAVSPLERVLSRLACVVPNGTGFYARCPVHGGEAPRLHVRADARGRVELRCPAGCKAGAIVDALGFDADDLRPDAPDDRPADVGPAARAAPASRPVLLCDSRESAFAASDAGYDTAWLNVPGGLWRDELADRFEGLAAVALVPDGGVRARMTAERAADAIHRLGVAVRLVALPALSANETLGDWLADRDRDALAAAVDAAAPWTGAAAGEPARSRFAVLTARELLELPPPEWLWQGLLPAGGLGALIGQPGAGKSFVALDLAAQIAAGGGKVLGRAVLGGAVLYVAAEGSAGLGGRLAAWLHAHGHADPGIPLHFITEGVNLFTEGDDREIVAACRQIATAGAPVRLVILDTLARVMPGGEENSAKDVGLVIAHAERIRRETGAFVLLVHHTAKNSDTERGSTALRGAVDTILLVRTDDPDAPSGVKLLVTDKQKDSAPAEPIVFTLEPVAADTAHGRVQSCRVALSAVRWTDAPDADAPLTPKQLDALKTLRDCFGVEGATATEWLGALGVPPRTFYRTRAALSNAGLILPGGARGTRIQVTAAGLRALSAPRDSVITASSLPRSVPPGGGGAATPLTGGVAATTPPAPARGREAVAAKSGSDRRQPAQWFDREFSDDEAPT